MLRIISILVRNHPGVLSHVAGLFTRRAYNIESIAAGETEDPKITRITITVSGDESVFQQVTKQLRKLIDVVKVQERHGGGYRGTNHDPGVHGEPTEHRHASERLGGV
jgi:acetolactate synthase-1/3 small subunit